MQDAIWLRDWSAGLTWQTWRNFGPRQVAFLGAALAAEAAIKFTDFVFCNTFDGSEGIRYGDIATASGGWCCQRTTRPEGYGLHWSPWNEGVDADVCVCMCIIYNIIQYKYQKVWVYLITITYTWNIWYKEDSIEMPMRVNKSFLQCMPKKTLYVASWNDNQ